MSTMSITRTAAAIVVGAAGLVAVTTTPSFPNDARHAASSGAVTLGQNGLIAFSSRRADDENTDDAEIWAVDSAGAHLAQLTKNDDADDTQPAFSPDGTKIAYVSTSLSEGSTSEIWTMNADGSGRMEISFDNDKNSSPTWSPDGRKLAYTVGGDLAIANSSGEGITTDLPMGNEDAGTVSSVSWSPLGDSLVYADGSGIFTMNPDGSNKTKLSDEVGVNPVFAPTGEWVYWIYLGKVTITSIDGMTSKNVVGTSGQTVAPSPDGTRLILDAGDGLWPVDTDGFEYSILLNDGTAREPTWGKVPVPCGGKPATFVGTSDSEVIVGTDGDDVIVGAGGNDVIDGRGGDDVICGGPGNDTVRGWLGTDALYGDAGNDRLRGDAGNDHLLGGDGSDTLRGAAGADYLSGGASLDFVTYEADPLAVKVTLDNVANDGSSFDGPSTSRDSVRTDVEGVLGSKFNDTLIGSTAANWLWGEGGDDVLKGGGGNDHVEGGSGKDSLYGEAGADVILGKDGVADAVLSGGADTDTGTRDAVDPAFSSVP